MDKKRWMQHKRINLFFSFFISSDAVWSEFARPLCSALTLIWAQFYSFRELKGSKVTWNWRETSRGIDLTFRVSQVNVLGTIMCSSGCVISLLSFRSVLIYQVACCRRCEFDGITAIFISLHASMIDTMNMKCGFSSPWFPCPPGHAHVYVFVCVYVCVCVGVFSHACVALTPNGLSAWV